MVKTKRRFQSECRRLTIPLQTRVIPGKLFNRPGKGSGIIGINQ